MGKKNPQSTRVISLHGSLVRINTAMIGIAAFVLLALGVLLLAPATGAVWRAVLVGLLAVACITGIVVSVAVRVLEQRLTQGAGATVARLEAMDSERLEKLPATQIQEFDQINTAIHGITQEAVQYASRMAAIVDAVGIAMGAFEVREHEGRVFFTESMFYLLGMAHGEEDSHFINLYTFAEMLPGLLLPEKHDVVVEERMLFEQMGNRMDLWLKIRMLRNGSTVYGTVVDVSEEEQRSKWLEFERDYDPLTRLLNRHSYPGQMGALIREQPEKMGVLLFGDLDNLKFINDTYGHDMGDRYIQMAAGALQRFECVGGVVARISGDEFAVYLHGADNREELRGRVDSFLKDIREESMELPDSTSQKVRISVGLSYYPDDATNIDMLVRYADFAMYEVKHSQKGGTKDFELESFEKNSYILHKLNQLDRLIEYRRLTFAYQPIIDVRTGEVFGYEALLRPLMREIHTPREVLTLAKNQSKLYQIEKLTLSYTLNWYQEHQKQMDGRKLFINLIANQKLSEEDLQELHTLMKNTGEHLVMEVSAGDYASGDDCLDEKIRVIRNLGYGLALDDYGTGYHNEHSLMQLTPEFVKLDMTLVRNIDTDETRQRMLRQIISYARSKQVVTIAEGVETKAELEMVIALGAQYVQGFYTGRPEYDLNKHIVTACEEASAFHKQYCRG